jgi:hypothetical protein
MKCLTALLVCLATIFVATPALAKPPGLTNQANLDVIGSNLTITPEVSGGYAVFWVDGFYVHQHGVWAQGRLEVMFLDPVAPGTRITIETPVALPVASIARRIWTPRGYPVGLDAIAIDFGPGPAVKAGGHAVVIERIESKWFGTGAVLDAVEAAVAKGVPAGIVQAANELDTGISLSGLLR